jgi:uncharacterized protein
MSREITPRTTLENLRKEAKRWLRALRSGDPEARARFERAVTGAPAQPGLRDVQLALAREHGLPGWRHLAARLGDAARTGADHPARLALFLTNACPDHHVRGGPEHVVARHTAMRLLQRHPEIARDSLFTAIVCGDLAEVERRLRERPESAREKGGPKGSAGPQSSTLVLSAVEAEHPRWEPLTYLCFTRLSLAAANDNAVAIARLLLDHGADPNAYFMAGDSHYTPLVGAVGEGEENRPPHPKRDELVDLLLERGAEPYDMQVVYDIHFEGDVLWFLKRMHARSLQLGRQTDWKDPEWSMLNMGRYGSGARWHLDIAIRENDLELAQWVLEHGASPNAAPARDPRFPKGTPHQEAMRRGQTAMADLLVRFGAAPSLAAELDAPDAFAAACLRLDRDEARDLARRNPEVVRSPKAMRLAVQQDRADVVALLLDLGVSPDVEDPSAGNQRPLHVAASADAVRSAALLLERGADVDFREKNFGGTPLGWAIYRHRPRMIELLGRHSRDVWNLVFVGNVERVREVLRGEPELAKAVHPGGDTPLMRLPDDEQRARELVDLFLACGADPLRRNADGLTAADLARKRGMDEIADRLRPRVG